jgi:tagaturonate reductase
MKLTTNTLKDIVPDTVIVPERKLLELPEKVLQFGTGILLRGLPDYFIDKANRMGIFNGRIIVVKSTPWGDSSNFAKQDGLYTVCVRGIQDGRKVQENVINSSISRVLHAQHDWRQILECAHNQNLQVIVSNTTEVGIKLVNEDIRRHPPASYPGKLLAFLYERFMAFGGSENSGFVIVPTELIPDNGEKLESIVLELAHLNGLEYAFIDWIEYSNYFRNSLVDRIVTGMPDDEMKREMEKEFGYEDKLLTVCEVYGLWAIEGDEHIKKVLSFAEADRGVIIEPDIDVHRELKLRLLNGTHTLSCGIALLSGIGTVKQAMDDEMIGKYIEDLMRYELGPSIPYAIDSDIVQRFIGKVLERFRNPHINHYWKNMTFNYSVKMKVRCIPMLITHYKKSNSVPELFALGFASYIYFMKTVKNEGNEFWQNASVEKVVDEVLKDITLWDEDLSVLPDFGKSVTDKLISIIKNGMRATMGNGRL